MPRQRDTRGRIRGHLWLATVLLVATGCTIEDEPTDTAPPPAPTPASAAQAARLLDRLVVGERHPSVPTYGRDEFGPAWADVEHNGCNQRDDVLLRDSEPGSTRVAPQGGCDHDVLSGTWVDPYTGNTITFDDLKDPRQAQAIQIDHVVPLAEAWRSGGWQWSGRRRAAYANDLGVLLAVDGPTNASKGSDDPAAWRPRKDYQCEYARRWITIKDTWQLAVDTSEVRALEEMLAFC